jgi:hypothetical protein
MRRLMAIAAAGFLVAGAANAAVTTYTSSAAFTAAAGSTTLVTFNDVASNVSFATSSVDAGPFSLLGIGPDTGTSFLNTQPQSGFFIQYNVDGTTYAQVGTSFGMGFAITFDAPIRAFGASFSAMQDGAVRTAIEVAGTTVTPPVQVGQGVRFFGFLSDTPFTTLRFVNADPTDGDGFGMDNVLFAAAAPVPAPGASALALGVLGMLAAGARRRKRPA